MLSIYGCFFFTCWIAPVINLKIISTVQFGAKATPKPTRKRAMWELRWMVFRPNLSAMEDASMAPKPCPTIVIVCVSSASAALSQTRSSYNRSGPIRSFWNSVKKYSPINWSTSVTKVASFGVEQEYPFGQSRSSSSTDPFVLFL